MTDKTTIQLSKSTLEKLNEKKFKLQAKLNKTISHDEVILILIKDEKNSH